MLFSIGCINFKPKKPECDSCTEGTYPTEIKAGVCLCRDPCKVNKI